MFQKPLFALLVIILCFCQCMAQNVEELWIESDGLRIFGVLSKPEYKGEKQPIVIISHGFNGDHQYGKNYFELFNSMGYQFFTFDFPHGSLQSRSGGGTLEMSIIDEQMALETVVRHFQKQDDVDASRMVLLGESQGGLISALVAANEEIDIDALILVFPALCIPDNWNSRYPQIKDIPTVTDLWGVQLGRRFFTELRYMNPYDIIGKYTGRVQIIQGDADKIVPLEYSVRASETYSDCRLHVIEGGGHGFNPEQFEESKRVMRDFIMEGQKASANSTKK